MNKFDSIYQEQLLELPTLERSAVQSIDWQTLIISIGKQYGLHLDELDELRTETMLVLIGITASGEYYDHLISQLAVSPSVAEKIVNDVNNQILTPIQSYIMRGGPMDTKSATNFGTTSDQNLGSTLEKAGITLMEETPQYEPAPAHIATGTLAHAGITTENMSAPQTATPIVTQQQETPLADTITKLLAEQKMGSASMSVPQKHDVLI